METKIKENGQANANSVGTSKTPQFVAGNPVNAVSQKTEETKKQEQPKPAEEKPHPETAQGQPKHEPSKADLKEQLAQKKLAFNLEETLKLVAELSKKTALRDKYKRYLEDLEAFSITQNEDDEPQLNSFQACRLTITDEKGKTFSQTSPNVIAATVQFMLERFTLRLAEVEAEIVLPA